MLSNNAQNHIIHVINIMAFGSVHTTDRLKERRFVCKEIPTINQQQHLFSTVEDL